MYLLLYLKNQVMHIKKNAACSIIIENAFLAISYWPLQSPKRLTDELEE
jgi:uncharacterized membrane protein YwzB